MGPFHVASSTTPGLNVIILTKGLLGPITSAEDMGVD